MSRADVPILFISWKVIILSHMVTTISSLTSALVAFSCVTNLTDVMNGQCFASTVGFDLDPGASLSVFQEEGMRS